MLPRRESHGSITPRPHIHRPVVGGRVGAGPHEERSPTLSPHEHLDPDGQTSADETTSLLVKRHTDDDEEEDDDDDCTQVETYNKGMKLLVKSQLPMVLGFLLEGLLNISTTAIAGQIGPVELGIVGNGNQIAGVTGFLIVLASTSAQMTLSAPLYTSKTNAKTDMGVIALRSFLLANISAIPIVVLWWYIKPVMLLLGQPESLAEGLKTYMRYATLSVPGYALMETTKSYLQAQGIFHPATYVVLIVLPFHIVFTYFLVHKTSLGANGAMVALTTSNWMIGLLLVCWIWKSKARECWGGWDRRALNGWGAYLHIMIPCIFMYGSEWWSFEVVSLLAGRLGEIPVAAQAAITNIDLFLAMIPYAGSAATLARLGNIIGHGQSGIRSAIIMVRAAYTLLGVSAIVIAIAMVIGREGLARVFTDDRETIELVKRVIIPMATYQVWDALQGAGGAVLRALAKQNLAASIHLIAYYLIAIPFGYYLAFHAGWGLVGLWTGQSFGLFLVAMIELGVYLFWIDWSKEMDKAEGRRDL